jgi:hypothetical protein
MSIAGFLAPENGIPGYSPAPMYSTNGETWEAMHDVMKTNLNTDSSMRLQGEAYTERNNLIKKRFGRDIIGEIRKEAPEAGADYITSELLKRADSLVNEGRIKEPNRWGDVKTNAEVEESARVKARMSRQAFDDVVSRNTNGLTKSLSIFGGAITGGFTDPLNLATLPLGAGAGRGIIKAAMIEGGLNATAEAAAVPFVKDWQQNLGYHYGFSEAVTDVGTAFVGGAALSSIIKGIVPATRAAGHYIGSASRAMLDRVASIDSLPQSVKNAASYMSRVAHIDEGAIPGTVKSDADLMAHREKLKETAEDFESYRSPSEEPIKTADELTPNQEAAVNRMVSEKTESVKTEISAAMELEFLERAKTIKASLTDQASVDTNSPSAMKAHLGYAPQTLSQFIKANGGIQDYAGELAARDITHKSLPGLVRKGKESNNPALLEMADAPSKSATDSVKERAWEAGYFPEKQDYNDITDSELYDAIAKDLKGERVYKESDMERIAMLQESSSLVDDYDRIGISADMTPEEIAQALRDADRPFDDLTDVAGSDKVQPLQRPEREFTPPEAYQAKRAAFDDLMKKNPKLAVTMEDGSQISLKELSDRLGEDLNAIEAITNCRLA